LEILEIRWFKSGSSGDEKFNILNIEAANEEKKRLPLRAASQAFVVEDF